MVLKSEVGPTNTGSFIRRLRSAARKLACQYAQTPGIALLIYFMNGIILMYLCMFEGDVWENEEEWDEITLDALFRPDADGRREQEAVEPDELTDDDKMRHITVDV